nr:MAG TPA_asm: hypothetical protein [Caudoviricetes sp.]DAP24362.1 MAG TPA: hypothetical protein [Caudoviricetes sp.]DAT90622.1 MAG TPA: hypothetical protein [Caudoviricetes sp.]DAV93427.1 MAG TPA: hypothetical protein [Caudoviricetes sp.]
MSQEPSVSEDSSVVDGSFCFAERRKTAGRRP